MEVLVCSYKAEVVRKKGPFMLLPIFLRSGVGLFQLFHPRLSKRQETIDAFSAIDARIHDAPVRCVHEISRTERRPHATAKTEL